MIKNILNEKIISLGNSCSVDIRLAYKDAPIYIAHYVFKDITSFVLNKLCKNDGNFDSIFSKLKNYDPSDLI